MTGSPIAAALFCLIIAANLWSCKSVAPSSSNVRDDELGASAELAAVPFEQKWQQARTFFEAGRRDSFRSPTGNVEVVFRQFINPAGHDHIVIFPGYAESSQKYMELIYDFYNRGYSVHIMTHRGMGESGREVSNRQIVHVDNFVDYYADSFTFVREHVLPVTGGANVFLFTHSTGGLIGANVIAAAPNLFKAAVLSSPLFEVNTGSHWRWVTRSVLEVEFRAGKAKSYGPGFQDWDPTAATFAENITTRSEERWNAYINFLREPANLATLPMGGPSVNWGIQSLDETTPAKVAALGQKIAIPILVLNAGDDQYVNRAGQDIFVNNAPHDTSDKPLVSLIEFPAARHEIYREVDTVRDRALGVTMNFFRDNAAAGSETRTVNISGSCNDDSKSCAVWAMDVWGQELSRRTPPRTGRMNLSVMPRDGFCASSCGNEGSGQDACLTAARLMFGTHAHSCTDACRSSQCAEAVDRCLARCCQQDNRCVQSAKRSIR